jgi:hypothetical protein
VNKSVYAIGNEQFRGNDKLQEYLNNNPKIVEELSVKVLEAMKTGVVVAPESAENGDDDDGEIIGKDEEFLKLGE